MRATTRGLVVVLLGLAAGCSALSYFENEPECLDGEVRERMYACGPCLMGTVSEVCGPGRRWVTLACVNDETDRDSDGFPNYDCGQDGPVDCNDDDFYVFPGATGREECIVGDTLPCETSCGTASVQRCTETCMWGPCVECVPGSTAECTTPCGSTGTATCTDECVPPPPDRCDPPPETCNGQDDDCDGGTDEDFRCIPGDDVECTTTCGSLGHGPCTDMCTAPAPSSCTPGIEVCNGQDDNCDGETDEGWPCPAGAIDRTCEPIGGGSGYRVCSLTCTWGPCVLNLETCNGLDDDGNGETDETFDCVQGQSTPCTTTCDATAHRSASGTGTCSASCTVPPPGECTPPAETCDGLDNDCVDGADNGFTCYVGQTEDQNCGNCRRGTQSRTCTGGCEWGAWSSCVGGGACAPGATRDCTTSCGSIGSQTCSSSCNWPTTCPPPDEVCNGRDDDCDGSTDEGFGCRLGETESCSHLDCGGSRTCVDECTWSPCSGYDTAELQVILYDPTSFVGTPHPYPWGSGCIFIGNDWASSMRVYLNPGQWVNLSDESCNSGTCYGAQTVCSFQGNGCRQDFANLANYYCGYSSGTVVCRSSPCDSGERTMNNTVNSISWSVGGRCW